MLAPIEEQGLASATFYLGLDIAMAFGPMISGVIDSVLPIEWFYPVELVLIPVILVVYFVWRKRLNGAIDNH